MANLMGGALRIMRLDDLERKLYERRKTRDEYVAETAEQAACFGKEPSKPDLITMTYNMEIAKIREELMNLRYPR